MHGQQAFLPVAVEVQALLRAMTKIALVITPAPSNALTQAQLFQPVQHLWRIIARGRQIVGAQRAWQARYLPTLTVAAHGRLCVDQRCAWHTGQLQCARGGQPCHAATSNDYGCAVHLCRRGQIQPLCQSLPVRAQAMPALQRYASKTTGQIIQTARRRLAARQQSSASQGKNLAAVHGNMGHQCSTLPHSRS